MNKFAAVVALLVACPAWARPSRIDPDALLFRYASNDGEIQLECKHYPLGSGDSSDSPLDFKVRCGIGTPIEKEYFVHLLFREHPRALEVLYSVSDRTPPSALRFTSQSLFLRYSNGNRIESATIGQSVENDYASLEIAIFRIRNRR